MTYGVDRVKFVKISLAGRPGRARGTVAGGEICGGDG